LSECLGWNLTRYPSAVPLRPETVAHLLADPTLCSHVHRLRQLLAADPALLWAAWRCGRSVGGYDTVPTFEQLLEVATGSAFWRFVAREVPVLALNGEEQPTFVRVWRYCVAAAYAARQLARQRGSTLSPSEAYVAAMAKNLGLYLVASMAPSDLEPILKTAPDIESLFRSRLSGCGLSLAELAYQMTIRWGLEWEAGPLALGTSELWPSAKSRALFAVLQQVDELLESTPFALKRPVRLVSEESCFPTHEWLLHAVRHLEAFLQEATRKVPGQPAPWLTGGLRVVCSRVARERRAQRRGPSRGARKKLTAVPAPLRFAILAAESAAGALAASTAVVISVPSDEGAVGALCASSFQRTWTFPKSVNGFQEMKPFFEEDPHLQLLAKWVCWPLCAAPDYQAFLLLEPERAEQVRRAAPVIRRLTVWLERRLRAQARSRALARLARAAQEARHEAVTKLEERLFDAIAEFSSGAAHELNNPLAVIAGRAQLLLESEADVERRRQLETILRQAMRVRQILEDLMLFAKPPEPKPTPTPLAFLVGRAVRELGQLAEECQVSVHNEVPGEGLLVLADMPLLSRAIRELIRNAVEASPRGGRVVITAAEEGDWVELDIVDQGPGIDEAARDRLFVPFFSGREVGRGLGLGLPIARRAVELHGGKLHLVTSSGGTRVQVLLRRPALAAESKCA
jgi:signal transduction histidine kinase